MAVVDTVLPLGGGEDGKSPLLIPAKSMVGYSPYTMHRRKDFYGEDAEEFKPERWEALRPGWVGRSTVDEIDSQLTALQEYLPFNGGPRICIGRKHVMNLESSEYSLTGSHVEQFALTEAS